MSTEGESLQPYAPPKSSPERSKPHRAIAILLSLFAAGSGQFYLGRVRRAIAWLAVATLGPIIAGAVLPSAARVGLFSIGWLLFLFAAAARPLSAIDALVVAPRVERPAILAVAVSFVAGICLVTASALATRRLLLEAFRIPSGAMSPTLLIGDHVFVDKRSNSPVRGRVFVFASPEHPEQDFVGRIVGVGGDRVEMRDGHPIINGWQVPHCPVGRGRLPPKSTDGSYSEGDLFVEYLAGEAYLTFLDPTVTGSSHEGPWTVASGEAFVLGDSRDASHDSRRWFAGAGAGVPSGLVRGEVVVVWLSVNSESGVRWSRIGQQLRAPRLPPSMIELQPALARCLASPPSLEAMTPPQATP